MARQIVHTTQMSPYCHVRHVLLYTIVLLLALFISSGVWLMAHYIRDPVNQLDRDLSQMRIVRDSTYAVSHNNDERIYRDVELYAPSIDTVRFTVSHPAGPDNGEPLPVVLIVGGLEIGRESLAYIPEHGKNALIAYEYPYGPEYWYEGTRVSELPAIRTAIRNVPAQLTAMTLWAQSQDWGSSQRTSVFGYSFGALFVPSFYRVAKRHAVEFNTGVMLYGGTDIYRLLAHNLRFERQWMRKLFARAAAVLLRPMEPSLHAPFLDTNFLVANGRRDQFIPAELALELQEKTAEPKTTMMLDTPHMHPQATGLIEYLISICMDWLVEHDAINL